MALEVPKLRTDDLNESGPWWRPASFVGVRTASLKCPSCKTLVSLNRHIIGDDGTVTPSVVCPTEDCGFHEMVVLKGWDE